MLVFWEQRLAFLATPKTGSTAIAAALESLAVVSIQRPPLLKHTTVHRYRRFIGPYLEAASKESFTLVALMREPRDWLGSWYRYRQREGTDPARSTAGMSFDDFVRAWCSEVRPEFAEVGSQERFLRSRNGAGVDWLFRYEDIGSFVHFLEDRLNCEIILPRLNVSPSGATELSAGTEALLHEKAAADFALYDTLKT
jgi:glycine/D-amino acid oxidase-like deaminating enzyme